MQRLEFWASPEATIARIDDASSRDQLAETGYDRRGAADALRLAVLGVSGARIPVLWERAAARNPGSAAFGAERVMLEALRSLAVDPIVTLLHHGSGPAWTGLLDPAFAERFAAYAGTVARAFPWVRRWTPINEPLTTARFATLYGFWYPNVRDERAFGRAMVHQTLAQLGAIERIREVIPCAEFVLTEDLQRFSAADNAASDYAAFLRERSFLSFDLLAGRVGRGHPLYAFLVERCAVAPAELRAIRDRAATPDVVAWNHYPHSERYLFQSADGAIGDVPAVYVNGEPAVRVRELLAGAARRTGVATALGEVHVHAPEAERVRWLAQHVDDVKALRAGGVDVRAIGAWAAFGMTDWHSLLRRRDGVTEDGIYTFAPHGEPQPTAVASALATLCAGGEIGDDGTRGWWERPQRYRTPEELLAMQRAGLPDGAHVGERVTV